jgi:hypothetical protein
LSPGVFGATRSNWIYHTAGAVSQTCKILKLICKYEALGKRVAIIETMEEPPEIILAAEWEWDYDDIFGAGKEPEKLKITCHKNPAADAFLLIYCPAVKYLSHLERIAEYWISQTAADKQAPNLFLHTVIFEEKGSSQKFQRLSTVMIHPMGNRHLERHLYVILSVWNKPLGLQNRKNHIGKGLGFRQSLFLHNLNFY